MQIAALIFGLLLATAYGATFHLIIGGPLRHIPLYLIAAIIGFTIGHLIGQSLDITLLKLGVVYLLPASLTSWLALIITYFLTQNTPQKPTP